MNETNIITAINKIVDNNFLGDDCAYLKDLGIVVTQDSLVEDIHFKREWYSPEELGYKSVAVNISDIFASGAEPKYVTISLSMANNVEENFVEEFYIGAKKALHGAQIVGGDITGSRDKVFISITAIGSDKNRKISSRKNAKEGYAVITKGNFGSSSAGLNELINNGHNFDLINAHKCPILEENFSKQIAESIDVDYAMMDTSDGLADALFKIAEASGVSISVDFDKIPHLAGIDKKQVLFGGEDYKLIAAIPEDFLPKVEGAVVIGRVNKYNGIRLDISGTKYNLYEELDVFNHFNN